MDIMHLKIAENCLRKMEHDIDPFYNFKPTFVEVSTYRKDLENNYENLTISASILDFGDEDIITENISVLEKAINDSYKLPRYISVDEKNKSVLVKAYCDDIMTSFNDYIKETFPFSYMYLDLESLKLNSLYDIRHFLKSDSIVASYIGDILVRKNYDTREFILEYDGYKVSEEVEAYYFGDLCRLLGELTLKTKGIKGII